MLKDRGVIDVAIPTQDAMQSQAYCPSCKALIPQVDVALMPANRYIGTVPGCWWLFGTVQARHMADPALRSLRTLTTNVYMVQHPGVPERQAVQSVAVHLMGIYWEIIQHRPERQVLALMQLAAQREYRWLDPPPTLGPLTIADLASICELAPDHPAQSELPAAEHQALAWRWAETTWQAWEQYHATVADWARNIQA